MGVLSPILELLKDNSFDIKATLKNLSPEKIAPIIKTFMNEQSKSPRETYRGQGYGIAPIAKIADKDVVYTLNKYLGG